MLKKLSRKLANIHHSINGSFAIRKGPWKLCLCPGSGGWSSPRPAKALKDKSIAAVVLRVDSPGGDALASDLMWKEIRELGKVKPIVASMSDVAASGGCEYMRPPRREGRRTD